MTAWVRDEILKLLHPFMPFVTEELWHVTAEGGPARDGLLALAPWPRHDALADHDAEAEIGWVIDLVTAIRSVRAEMNITAAEIPLVLVGVSPATEARAGRWADVIRAAWRGSPACRSRTRAPRGLGAAHRARRGRGAAARRRDRFRGRAGAAREGDGARSRPTSRASTPSSAMPTSSPRAPEEVVEGEREKREEAEIHRRKIDEALERLGAVSG